MSFIPKPQTVTLDDGYVELASLQDVVSEIDSSLPTEGYAIDITAAGVNIKGGSETGLFYARQTLRQLLPPSTLRKASNTKGPWRLQEQHILDAPSSGLRWRGCMLDVARHFMPVPDLLRFIELLAFHKLNVLHLHLTDDQGWRFQVPSWPRLTSIGGWRSRSMQGSVGHELYDARPHGGFYSAEDLHEIVAFASERHITIIPEVNMPGHMQAAIAAYPELGNTDIEGGQTQSLQVREAWGVSTHVLNVSDETLAFCRAVLDFICNIFPSKTICIGGDECPYDEWRASTAAQARMTDLGLTQEVQLQAWFTSQMTGHLASRGRHAYAWDEVMAGYTGPVEAFTVAAWRGPRPTLVAAQRGYKTVTCPDIYAYLDYRQSEEPDEPTPMGTLLTLEHMYSWQPKPAELRPEEAANIIGAQVNVWSEHMETARRVEYMVFPRLCAFAEVAWGKGSNDNDFDDFRKRLEEKHIARLEALGVNYRPQTGPRFWDARPGAPGKTHTMAERLAWRYKATSEL